MIVFHKELSPFQVLEIALKTIRAVKEIHEKGLSYGRISPTNIMIKEIDELDIRLGF